MARLRRRLAEIVAIDFFDALGRQSAEGLVAGLEARLHPEASETISPRRRRVPRAPLGHSQGYSRRSNGKRLAHQALHRSRGQIHCSCTRVPTGETGNSLDMFEAEFTHEGDRCTFEVLLQRLKLKQPALRAIAEIVHDIDLKDGKFGRPETPGIERLITGICSAHKEDVARLARVSEIFEDLLGSFGRKGN